MGCAAAFATSVAGHAAPPPAWTGARTPSITIEVTGDLSGPAVAMTRRNLRAPRRAEAAPPPGAPAVIAWLGYDANTFPIFVFYDALFTLPGGGYFVSYHSADSHIGAGRVWTYALGSYADNMPNVVSDSRRTRPRDRRMDRRSVRR